MWDHLEEVFGDLVAVSDPHRKPKCEFTFKELNHQIGTFAAGLRAIGLRYANTSRQTQYKQIYFCVF